MIAARGKAFRIKACWRGVKPRLGRYLKMRGSQAPQMKNSMTIMRNSLPRGLLVSVMLNSP
jgi:hypothetical protein